MKPLIRSSRILLMTWLCLVTALDFKAVSGFVLCLGEDGHVELENSVDDKCGSPDDAAHSENPAFLPVAEDHCGDCLDVQLSGIVPQSLKLRGFDAPMDMAAIPVSESIPSEPRPAVIKPASQIHGPSRELNSLRNIRLLV